MPAPNLRDPRRLSVGLDRWLAAMAGPGAPMVTAAAHASAGWANETLVVELSAPLEGHRRVVVRLPPVEPCFPDENLSVQAAVQRAVAAYGVPAPVPIATEADASWLGAPFMVMAFVDGHVPDQVPAFDPWINGLAEPAQRRVAEAFFDVMASVHTIDWRAAGLRGVVRGADGGPGALEAELDWWARYVGWSAQGAEPLAILGRALEWCRAQLPRPEPPPSLLWGDPRLGNLVFDVEQVEVAAVLDWELALVGPAEVDLGWYLGQDRVITALLGRTVPGFPTRPELLARYQAALGRPLADLRWFEVFGLLRSLAIDVRLGSLARRVGASYPTAPDETNPLVGALAARLAGE